MKKRCDWERISWWAAWASLAVLVGSLVIMYS